LILEITKRLLHQHAQQLADTRFIRFLHATYNSAAGHKRHQNLPIDCPDEPLFLPVFAHHLAPASHHAPVAVFAHVSNGERYFFNPVVVVASGGRMGD
jgi:hypothetical protein